MKAEEMKHQLENAEVVNQQQEEQIAHVNQQLKDAHLASKASSFLDLHLRISNKYSVKYTKSFGRL